jgi:hypothetical protein
MFNDAFGDGHGPDLPGWRWPDWLAFFLFIWVITAWLMTPARAHGAYDYRCCGERDCAAVPDQWVHESGDVIVFRIPPGGHPMWATDKTVPLVVEFDRFRLETRRMDGRWHLCLNPSQFPLCVYPPERGF